MRKILIIGGANGIGLAVALAFANKGDNVFIVDKSKPAVEVPDNIHYEEQNLTDPNFNWIQKYSDVEGVFYSAGFGRVAYFEELTSTEIDNSFKVNTIAAFKVLFAFMGKLKSDEKFLCGVMVSIAGRIASPLFSIYSATKAALFRGIEAINIELEKSGSVNRILEVSPGSIKGTNFSGEKNDLDLTKELANEIIKKMEDGDTLYIPEYETVFKNVIDRYIDNPHEFALSSYDYKIKGGRLQKKPQIKIGYLSGTFDLFHIGHLNLLRRAKQHCDYLVVGLHKDGSHKGKEVFIPFEERMEILKSISYVDEVIQSEKEDSDIYKKGILKYDRLFVGSDYKGTERFNRYEEYFADKGVEIIYFPYTKGTSSTQLRDALSKK